MNQLSQERRVRVVAALDGRQQHPLHGPHDRGCQEHGGKAAGRTKLGTACARHHDETVRGLRSERIQADEVWSFVYAKAKNLPADKKGVYGYGDAWTWTAMDADSKLMISYMIGPRTPPLACELMKDPSFRIASTRPQLTTDGLPWYAQAVEYVFGIDVDYATVEKHFGVVGGDKTAATRYSPAKVTGVRRAVVCGAPDSKHVSTSYVERQNLTMRMGMRRFTRLTNAFSKKLANLEAAVTLHFTYYNFARVHQTLRVTPAMEAGVSDHVWSLAEIVALL